MKFSKFVKGGLFLGVIAIVALVSYEYHIATGLVRFRTTSDSIKPASTQTLPNLSGFADLHISGDQRPTKYSLKKAFSHMKVPVYVVDLLGEGHYYIKGMPEHWYGYEYTDQAITPKKGRSLRKILHSLLYTGKLQHQLDEIQTEEELVEECGYHYLGLDQRRKGLLLGEKVDELIHLVENLPIPAWVHFHCSAGRGRTTVAMVLFDILKNGRQVPLEDIIQRHILIGSENLLDTTVWPKGQYTKEMLENRRDFVVAFYNYVNDPEGYGTSSWVEWSEKHNVVKEQL